MFNNICLVVKLYDKRAQETPLQGGTVAAIGALGWTGVRGVAAVPPDTSRETPQSMNIGIYR